MEIAGSFDWLRLRPAKMASKVGKRHIEVVAEVGAVSARSDLYPAHTATSPPAT
jgi:hypothetical protein